MIEVCESLSKFSKWPKVKNQIMLPSQREYQTNHRSGDTWNSLRKQNRPNTIPLPWSLMTHSSLTTLFTPGYNSGYIHFGPSSVCPLPLCCRQNVMASNNAVFSLLIFLSFSSSYFSTRSSYPKGLKILMWF